jgi:hypothetical protein
MQCQWHRRQCRTAPPLSREMKLQEIHRMLMGRVGGKSSPGLQPQPHHTRPMQSHGYGRMSNAPHHQQRDRASTDLRDEVEVLHFTIRLSKLKAGLVERLLWLYKNYSIPGIIVSYSFTHTLCCKKKRKTANNTPHNPNSPVLPSPMQLPVPPSPGGRSLC